MDENNNNQNESIFLKGVGVVSKEDIAKALGDEVVGDVFVGKNFTFSDLDEIQKIADELRRDGNASSEELSKYNDKMLSCIERKLRIREVVKSQNYTI